MDLKQYAKDAMATCKTLTPMQHDLHMLLGMATEIGELMDVYKKFIAYGKDIDIINVKEELGDIMWYWINFCTANGINPGEVLQLNSDKLKARYPEKFTSDAALNRDLAKERRVLEGRGRELEILDELGYEDMLKKDLLHPPTGGSNVGKPNENS